MVIGCVNDVLWRRMLMGELFIVTVQVVGTKILCTPGVQGMVLLESLHVM